MILKIVSSTDKKFIGVTFDSEQPIILDSFEFKSTQIKDIGDGLMQISNSNYVVVAEQT